MTTLTRRTALTAIAVAPAAVATMSAVAASDDAETRIKYHTRELEKAMYERYELAVEVLRFEPSDGMVASILLAANGRATARPAARSKWLYVGE